MEFWKNIFSSSNKSDTGLGNLYSMEYAEAQDALNSSGSTNAGKVDLGLGNGVGSSGTNAQGNDTWGTIGTIGKIGVGLGQTWLGAKQLKAAEKAFDYNVMDKNRTYAMAKDAYDKNVARAGSIGKQMNAGKVG